MADAAAPRTGPGRQGLAHRVRLQAEACERLGSPFYRVLLDRIADDILSGGPSADVLAGHENDPGPSGLALRLMGSVHRLVLENRAPELGRFYPSVGGTADAGAAWPVLRDTLAEHRDELRGLLPQPPQTNEVGRATALLGGLVHITAAFPGPVRLFEIGASAGLNLRADHFRVSARDGAGLGPADSPVQLVDGWRGATPPLTSRLEVVERGGCDVAPLDPVTDEGRLLLTSYVWPDQAERLERLRGALAIAARVPAVVDREPAEEWVRRVQLVPGTTTVLWHSVMWQYLDPDERADILTRMNELGAVADRQSRLAHLFLEPRRRTPTSEHEFLVVLQLWPDGAERILGTAEPHGVPTTWA